MPAPSGLGRRRRSDNAILFDFASSHSPFLVLPEHQFVAKKYVVPTGLSVFFCIDIL